MDSRIAHVRRHLIAEEVWIHAGDVAKFIEIQSAAAFDAGDQRGHKILSWLSYVFQELAEGSLHIKEINAPTIDGLPSIAALQQDLVTLHSELQEEEDG